jgi:hypothetical protein
MRRNSLFEIFRACLHRRDSETSKLAAPSRPFQAVSIDCGIDACEAARALRDQRFLAKRAPPLPLASCTHPNSCECRYLKHKDRRAENRRAIGFIPVHRRFGPERRRRPGRRATD